MSTGVGWLFLATTAIIAYAVSIAIYRLYLSPLSTVPGPKLAALTSWYECYYDVILPGQYVFKIKELHDRYGPIVRISPREISFSDPAFVDTIYAPGAGFRRDKDLKSVRAVGTAKGLGATIEHGLHKRRRAPLSSLFSRQSVLRQASGLLEEKTAQAEEIFSQAAASGEVINLSEIYFGLMNDVVCQYSFGTNDNILGDQSRARVLRGNIHALLRTTNFAKHFIWIRDLLSLLPIRYAPPGVQDMVRFREQIRVEIEAVLKDKAAQKRDDSQSMSIFHVLKETSLLPAPEKARDRLEDEAALLVMAGTESPATALSLAHYHMLSDPIIMDQMRRELAENPSSDLGELEQLPYINAIQMEAYRLGFGLSGRHPMIDPDKTTTYLHGGKRYDIPPGTPMSVQTLILHTNEHIYPDPWAFKPERWLGEDGLARRKHILSFNKGARQCLGINLARAELSMGIALATRWDMSLFQTDDDDVAFFHDYFVATPKLDSKGVRVCVKGRAL